MNDINYIIYMLL